MGGRYPDRIDEPAVRFSIDLYKCGGRIVADILTGK